MTLGSLTRAGVLAAVVEFDELGQNEFLRKYGFKKAKSYFLQVSEKLYDSKAIAGAALGMAAGDFSGGDQTVAKRLEALDFTVQYFPVLAWTREEIILACAIVAANNWRQPASAERDLRVIELSELLQTGAFYPIEQHGPDFRNTAGVARKMADIATSHPDYRGRQTRGNRLDAEVVLDFIARPVEMTGQTRQLRAQLLGLRPEQMASVEVIQPRGTTPVVFDVPVESHRTAKFTVSAAAERQASRVEAALMKRYQEAMASEGHGVTGKVIQLPEEASRLRIDLYDVDRAELIEAKGSAAREYVRLALGQVLDYARYVEHEHLAVLLPERPRVDLVNLLASHGIRCIYEVAEGEFERE